MKLFNKTSWRFLKIFAAIVAGSIVIAYTTIYFSPEARQGRAIEDLREQYANDTYGGETPEETLELFIEALEAGDVELASKYFVVEKQEEMKKFLLNVQNKYSLNDMIVEAKQLKLSKLTEDKAFFSITNDMDVVEVQIVLYYLSINNKWKISEL